MKKTNYSSPVLATSFTGAGSLEQIPDGLMANRQISAEFHHCYAIKQIEICSKCKTVNPRNGIYQWDGWGMPYNTDYKYMGGTSMSNPIAAGGVTVIRDYYQEAKGINASAALVKATVINSAVDMADENNDGANDNDFPIPNVHAGWGPSTSPLSQMVPPNM